MIHVIAALVLSASASVQFVDGAQKSDFVVCQRKGETEWVCFDYQEFHKKVRELEKAEQQKHAQEALKRGELDL